MIPPASDPWVHPDPEVIRFGKTVRDTGGRWVHDLGCGTGRHTLALGALGLHVVASDTDPDALRMVEQDMRRRGYPGHTLLASMLASPLRTASLDGLVAFNVLYHARRADMAVAVAEIGRTLKPDGLLYLTLATPGHGSYGRGMEIEPRTFLPPSGVLHHFMDRRDARTLLRALAIEAWQETSMDYVSQQGETIRCVHWRITARKPRDEG
jgi:SAM-dependent methyltransferase